MELRIFADGACRGNPGSSAIAFIILDSEGRVIKEHSEYIGIGTNNQAEYKALILALKSALDFGNEVVCSVDSKLVAKQMSGEWQVRHPNMRPLWREAVSLKEKFRKTIFKHVSRTNVYMQKVDELANLELDRSGSKSLNVMEKDERSRQETLL